MKNLNTSDLYERLQELEEEKTALEEEIEGLQNDPDDYEDSRNLEEVERELSDWEDSEDGEEYNELMAFCDEIGYSKFQDGVELVHENNLVDHAREIASETHNLKEWPLNCVDWDEAANKLQDNYSSCEYQGQTYYYKD